MIEQAIRDFPKQFAFEPVVENAAQLAPAQPAHYSRIVVAGMGGSALPAALLHMWRPALPLTIHRDYGLPGFLMGDGAGERSAGAAAARTLVVASSYSGNTEETLDAFDAARAKGCATAAIGVGGKLLDRANEAGAPYVELPDTGIQPRMALGFSVRALLAVLGLRDLLDETRKIADTLDSKSCEAAGKKLAETLRGRVPVVYSSLPNHAIAYNWKVKFNETGKVPAFCNAFSELNHNEMTGFDAAPATKALSDRFTFITLEDDDDHPRIRRRADVLAKLYADRGLPVLRVPLRGTTIFMKTFTSLLIADWTAYYLARHYGVEAEQVPMVEEFKKLI